MAGAGPLAPAGVCGGCFATHRQASRTDCGGGHSPPSDSQDRPGAETVQQGRLHPPAPQDPHLLLPPLRPMHVLARRGAVQFSGERFSPAFGQGGNLRKFRRIAPGDACPFQSHSETHGRMNTKRTGFPQTGLHPVRLDLAQAGSPILSSDRPRINGHSVGAPTNSHHPPKVWLRLPNSCTLDGPQLRQPVCVCSAPANSRGAFPIYR